MNFTDYQAKYLAYELTRLCPSDSIEKLAAAVPGAQVDLNPHQVDAALFAFQAVLGRCEWGKDDYSLKVENLPKAPPKEGQQELF